MVNVINEIKEFFHNFLLILLLPIALIWETLEPIRELFKSILRGLNWAFNWYIAWLMLPVVFFIYTFQNKQEKKTEQ